MQIEINNLQKCFGDKTAVNIEHFTIQSGEMLGLVGNNGAGKTTLFRLLLDLQKADNGRVAYTNSSISDLDPSTSEEWKNYVGTYIDDSFLIDFLTPEEYFDFIAKVNGIGKDTKEERLKLYETFANNEIFGTEKLIRDFSAGNKQKIGIIAAMLNCPQLLILDEPFNFLDPSSQNILKKMLEEYHKETGATILVSSHNLQHTVDISSRIALMERGIIIKNIANNDHSATQELEDYFNTSH